MAHQRQIAEELAADGHGEAAEQAATLLRTMEQALDAMREHREIILQEIAAPAARV